MAMRAAGIKYEHREVLLKHKPAELVQISAKGTVPVLMLSQRDTVIDESIDVMRWALARNSPQELSSDTLGHEFVQHNDNEFKPILDKYKYSDPKNTGSKESYFELGSAFLSQLNTGIVAGSGNYLLGSKANAADIAIFPFIRQFANVDLTAFRRLQLTSLEAWLNLWLKSGLFLNVMQKFAPWRAGETGITVDNLVDEATHLADEQRFVIGTNQFEETEFAVLKYRYLNPQTIDIYSTFVPSAMRGGGLAGRLADAALAWALQQNFDVKTSCWYAARRLQAGGQ